MSEPDKPTDLISEALKSVETAQAMVRGATEHADQNAGAQPAAEAPAAQSNASTDASAAEMESLKSQLEFSMAKGRELMEKIKDEHEKMLRAVADLENYKKRAQKEKEEIQKFGIEKLLRDFLPVVDNFDRALGQSGGATELDSLKKGVEMIRKLFEDALGKHGVKSFTSKGEPFDPNKHEAMSAAETDEMPPNHVFSEYLRGFTLNDRLVRPALVVVSKAKTSEVSPSGEEQS